MAASRPTTQLSHSSCASSEQQDDFEMLSETLAATDITPKCIPFADARSEHTTDHVTTPIAARGADGRPAGAAASPAASANTESYHDLEAANQDDNIISIHEANDDDIVSTKYDLHATAANEKLNTSTNMENDSTTTATTEPPIHDDEDPSTLP
ncbi:hypothetical protein LTR70_003570 [Exophiala xenobiotica]|uniref:Uncharacterized protein n=1 Tax=Lithohypha guttulata TaxID=1690604 RepID=A0ABR0KFY5_9EURO|nr:hypothetical protein LTR24_003118 [Lithohypha guttulata]KAK5322949.1 hypothetical protein LTR70_003570 [Exophiala xenobiotica]